MVTEPDKNWRSATIKFTFWLHLALIAHLTVQKIATFAASVFVLVVIKDTYFTKLSTNALKSAGIGFWLDLKSVMMVTGLHMTDAIDVNINANLVVENVYLANAKYADWVIC